MTKMGLSLAASMALFVYLRPVATPVEPISVETSNSAAHQKSSQPKWAKSDLMAIAKTLAGECYDDKVYDKRLVCEVILNRVSDDRFANSVIDVLETPNAFDGYWQQSRRISDNDIFVAEKALTDWYANDCQPLSDIRYFSAGEDRENIFR